MYLQLRLLKHLALPSFARLLRCVDFILDRLLGISTTSNPDERERSYPERAIQGDVEVVVSACGNAVHVADDGLTRCRVVQESPILAAWTLKRHPNADALRRVVI